MNECPSMPVSDATANSKTVRSIKSTSNRSRKSATAKSITSRKSNANVCSNDFVVVGGGIGTIDIALPRQK